MLEAGAVSTQRNRTRWLLVGLRLVVGYVLAVAVGAIVFTVIAYLVPGLPLLPDPVENDPLGTMGNTALLYFIFGMVFGIPYTILGSLAFQLWLPKTKPVFLALGALCPASAILLTLVFLGGLSLDGRMALNLLATLPAGFAAAHAYGAIGFGYGFRRWRFG